MILPPLCLADQPLPFLYSRSDITIMRARPPAPLPWLGKDAPAQSPGVVFDVEVRDASMLYNQQGWFSLGGMAENSGMLMMFSAPATTPLPSSSQYAPLDILMIDAEGKITQIAPNIVLTKLEQEIVPDAPILAFMFLKGGTCEKMSINPGDRMEYVLFKKHPTVLGTVPQAQKMPVPAKE